MNTLIPENPSVSFGGALPGALNMMRNGSQLSTASASMETRVRVAIVPGSDRAESGRLLAGMVVASVGATATGDPRGGIVMPETSVERSSGGRTAVSGDVSAALAVDAARVPVAFARSRWTTSRSNASRFLPASIKPRAKQPNNGGQTFMYICKSLQADRTIV